MNLFAKSKPQAHLKKLKEIKNWVYQELKIDAEISISISQLKCHEPDCPPVETVITVMTNPPKQFKIHKSSSQITEIDIKKLCE